MSKNNNRQKSSDLDLFSPFVEIFTEIIEALMKVVATGIEYLVKETFQFIDRKYFNKYPLSPLKSKSLSSHKKASAPDTLGFSINHKTQFKAADLNTGKHTAIIGSTGSGKTVCTYLLIELALKKGMPVIYFDPKASTENIETFRKICHANNKKLYVFSDLLSVGTPFNPLSGGNLGDISDKIINALEWSEPFYKNESIEALDDVLQVLKFSHTPITLETIVEEL